MQCPECEVPLEEGHDRHNYEYEACPECGRWKRPNWVDLREPPEGGLG